MDILSWEAPNNAGGTESRVQSLIREDPLEEEMAIHPSILVWEIRCTEDPGGPQSLGSHSWTRLSMHNSGVLSWWAVSLFLFEFKQLHKVCLMGHKQAVLVDFKFRVTRIQVGLP